MSTEKTQFDADGQSLGRLSVMIADTLRAKNSPSFLPNKQPKNKVVVFNTDKLNLSLKKQEQKMYYSHSGYPGGLSQEPLASLFKRDSREVIKRSVYGMLPKNRLRDVMMTNLDLYKGDMPKKV